MTETYIVLTANPDLAVSLVTSSLSRAALRATELTKEFGDNKDSAGRKVSTKVLRAWFEAEASAGTHGVTRGKVHLLRYA